LLDESAGGAAAVLGKSAGWGLVVDESAGCATVVAPELSPAKSAGVIQRIKRTAMKNAPLLLII
jgi:hypothetical protein